MVFERAFTTFVSLSIVALASAVLPPLTADKETIERASAAEVRFNQTLSAGAGHLCSINGDGELACWGLNLDGQVGDGTEEIRDTLTQVGVEDDWLTVSAGNRFTCAIRQRKANSGSLWCWGANDFGQLGIGSLEEKSTPTQVGRASDWVTVSTGRDHACAVRTNGGLYCWGSDDFGQVGNGAVESSDVLSPIRVGADQVWTRVSSGYGSTLAVDSNGNLWGWGFNDVGQLGDGTTTNREQPTQIGSDDDDEWAEPIAARPYDWEPTWWSTTSSFFSCALKTDGSLWCAGDNSSGQFGDGSYDSSNVFVRSGGNTNTYLSASIGESYMCGVQMDGSLWCWGSNDYVTVAPYSPEDYFVDPEQVGALSNWVAVAVGPSGDLDVNPWYFNAGACAMNTSGALFCWGSNDIGQQGRGLWARDIGGSWESATAGRGFSCGIRSGSGTAECWGTNSYGRMGTGEPADAVDAEPRTIANDDVTGWSEIFGARYLSCGIASAGAPIGSAWCWGNTRSGGLGNGDYSGSYELTPIRVGNASCASDPDCDYNFAWTKLSPGVFSACGITTSGELWCWGEGSAGELGDGESGTEYYDYYYLEPHRSTALFRVGTAGGGIPTSDWIDIASNSTGIANGAFRCGIREVSDDAGTLWCWGGGPIGNGNLVPNQVGSDDDWVKVALGSQHACAIKHDQSLWCWGINNNGELGIGAAGNQAAPTRVGASSDWIDIALGWEMSCGIRTVVDEDSGEPSSLYCWGDNSANILGKPATVANSNIPLRVRVDFNPERVSMTESHACVFGGGAIGCHGSAYELELGTWMAREGTSSTMLLPTSARLPEPRSGGAGGGGEPGNLSPSINCAEGGILPDEGSEIQDIELSASQESVAANASLAGDEDRVFGKILTGTRSSGVRIAHIGSNCVVEIITSTGALQIIGSDFVGPTAKRAFIWSEQSGWEPLATIGGNLNGPVNLPTILFDRTGHYIVAITDGTEEVATDAMWGTKSALISLWITTPRFVVTFAPDSARLSAKAKRVLSRVAEEIARFPGEQGVVVTGFLNPFTRQSGGPDRVPLTLANLRAERIRRYLIKLGLNLPIASQTAERGSDRTKSKNRKGVIVINWGTGT